MKKIIFALIVLVTLVSCQTKQTTHQANLSFIPIPQNIQVNDDTQHPPFTLTSKTVICTNSNNNFNAEYLQNHLKNIFKGSFNIVNEAKSNYIKLEIIDSNYLISNDVKLTNESYMLSSNAEGITISSNTSAGIFYGIQTLLQMMPTTIYTNNSEKYDGINIPNLVIKDFPRFAYRGMMLDCSRTFFDVDYIKKFLDGMAYHKINNFHWHLADDQGWRAEIKQYPKLTEIGAWRGENEALLPAYGSGMERNGGFYSQEEIKDIVKYAANRNINIIPEIDLPGHSKAVAVTYPEILCDIDEVNYSVQFESNNVWCVGREENYIILEDIVKELTTLFPSQTYHIGGDEVNMDSWKECPHCQDLMKEKKMKNVIELQNYFVRQMESILAKYGKTMAGWDEILDGGELMKKTTPYAWRSLDRGMASVKAGHPTVMQVAQYMYFDMKQSIDERGLMWAGIIPLQRTYEFDPIDNFELTEDENRLVLGPQGGLWTECGQMTYYADYQVYPKLCALSEIGWSPKEKRNFKDFENRLYTHHIDRLYAMDFKFRIAPPAVKYENGKLNAESESDRYTIRYTDDKTQPTAESPVYVEAISTETPENYRFAAFFNDRNSISRGAQNIDLHHYLKPTTKVTSSIPFNEDINRLVDYDLNTYCFSSRAIKNGDYIEFVFDNPVECNTITMCTGYYQLAIIGIPNGNIEYSYDGTNFEKGEDFKYDYFDGYKASCYPIQAVKAVRINVTGIGEHELVIIQDLRIE